MQRTSNLKQYYSPSSTVFVKRRTENVSFPVGSDACDERLARDHKITRTILRNDASINTVHTSLTLCYEPNAPAMVMSNMTALAQISWI